MEKKYLIGYVYGKPLVAFEDVSNFSEEADEYGDIHVKFTDKDGEYHYIQDGSTFREVNGKAPTIDSYEVRGRRTINRRGYFEKPHVEVKPEEKRYNSASSYEGEESRTEPETEDEYIRRVGTRVKSTDETGSCGPQGVYYRIPGECGNSGVYRRGACGGWTRVSETPTCGGSSRFVPYYTNSGCGGSGGCGGGGC